MAKFYKNEQFYIGFGKVGRLAYTVSNKFKIGIHFFKDSHIEFGIRVVYFIGKSGTYYWEFLKEKKLYEEGSEYDKR